jgi:hypothetical protein
MSVTSQDIAIYTSQNMPQDDTSIAGGSINSGIRVVFTDIVSTGVISASSNSASDSGTLSIVGRDAAGVILSENISLSGTSDSIGVANFERILSCQLDSASNGTVSISGTQLVGNIFPTESGFKRVFYDATANDGGGPDKTLYEKVFVKNNNSTTALQDGFISEVSTGLYSIIEFGLEKSYGYNESVVNRLTAPTGVTSYGDNSSGVADTNLGPLDAQGVWLKLFLAAGTSSTNSFYRLQVQGTTT